MPEVFIFVLLIIFGAPIAKAIAARIARGQAELPGDAVARLRQELLEAAEQHAHESDKRVLELEDRVEFLEKLLQAPKSPPPLAPPGGPPVNA
ncbi:MAG TPA: hypothetical protein VF832_14275 [Longimicrobiales bacterium]